MAELLQLSTAKLLIVAFIAVVALAIKFRDEIRGLFSRANSEEDEVLDVPVSSAGQFMKSVSVRLCFNEAIHARKEDKLGAYLSSMAQTIRGLGISARTLVVDFGESDFVNSTCYAQTIAFINDVIRQNGISLILRVPKTRRFQDFAQQMRYLTEGQQHITIEEVEKP